MPNKAKLVTRSASTTSVVADNIPKADTLTHIELDSNLINLRDATFGVASDDSTTIDISMGNTLKIAGAGVVTTAVSGQTLTITGTAGNITIVGDDSTGTTVSANETFKIAGTQNITTAVSGDTLTITGPNLSSYLTNSPITMVGDDSTGTTLNTGETIKIAGTQNITTAVSGDTLTITGPDLSSYATTTYVDNKVNANNTLTIADDTSTTSAIDLDNTLQVIGGHNITTSISGSTLTISGDKSIDVNEINSGDSSAIQINDAVNVSGTLNAKTIVTNDLISEDSTAINVLDGINVSGETTINNTLAVTSTSTFTGDAKFLGSITGDTNLPVTIAPDGTGDVHLNADSVRIGDNNTDATIATRGTGDLIITTHEGSANEGVIRLADGANGNITLTPNGTGSVVIDGISHPQADGTNGQMLITNGSGVLSFSTPTTGTVTSITAGTGLSGGTITTSGTIAIDSTVATLTGTQTLTNKTLTTPVISSITNTGTLTLPISTDTLIGRATTDTLTNKSISLTTNTITGTLTEFNNALSNDNFVSLTGTETLTNKTLTTPVIASITNTGTLTLPTSTDTLIGRATTDTLTNKTLTSPVIAQVVSVSNGNIELAPDGTGDVNLTADTVRVGDSNADVTITTNGTGDLILNTNAGSNSGSITIADAANGNITLKVDGTGKVIMGDDFTAANLDNYTNASNSFPGFSDIAVIKSNLLFTSTLAVPNITTFADRHFNNVIYSYGKADSAATTYNDADFRWGNMALSLFDMAGATANSTVTNSRAAAIRGMAITTGYKNSGGGTKTTPNQVGITAFNEIQEGHGGDLTVVNQMGARVGNSVRANTGEFSRITNAIGYIADTISAAGTGTNGTNRFVTNEFGFYDAPTTSSSLVTNHYGYYVHTGAAATNKYAFYSADDTYLSRLGTVERVLKKQNALTSSSTITVDCDLAPVHTVTLNTNTGFVITNLTQGQTVKIIIKQDATGSRTATFGAADSSAIRFPGGSRTLTTTASAIDVVTIYYDGSDYLGELKKDFNYT